MRKTLVLSLIVIPFHWSNTKLKKPTKLPVHPPAKVWSLPDAVKKILLLQRFTKPFNAADTCLNHFLQITKYKAENQTFP